MALHVEGVEFCVLMSRTTLGSRQATVARYRLLRMRIQSGHTDRPLFMSGDSAAGTLVEIKLRQLERSGKKLSEEEKKELYESVKRTYDEQTDPRYGAARLWIDKIIDPMETRDAIVLALEAAALNPDVPEFKVGVLQT